MNELPTIPTVPMHRPGQEPPLVYVTHEVVTKEFRDEPYHGYNADYVAITCPQCDWTRSEWGSMNQHIWMDYEHHINRHIGRKTAIVTVEGRADFGWEPRAAGKHFRRHTSEHVDLLDFSLVDDDKHRQAYTATFACGKWRGDVSNRQLSNVLNKMVDFAEFESVTVEWQHKVPKEPIAEGERVEKAKYRQRAEAVADG